MTKNCNMTIHHYQVILYLTEKGAASRLDLESRAVQRLQEDGLMVTEVTASFGDNPTSTLEVYSLGELNGYVMQLRGYFEFQLVAFMAFEYLGKVQLADAKALSERDLQISQLTTELSAVRTDRNTLLEAREAELGHAKRVLSTTATAWEDVFRELLYRANNYAELRDENMRLSGENTSRRLERIQLIQTANKRGDELAALETQTDHLFCEVERLKVHLAHANDESRTANALVEKTRKELAAQKEVSELICQSLTRMVENLGGKVRGLKTELASKEEALRLTNVVVSTLQERLGWYEKVDQTGRDNNRQMLAEIDRLKGLLEETAGNAEAEARAVRKSVNGTKSHLEY